MKGVFIGEHAAVLSECGFDRKPCSTGYGTSQS